MEVHFRMKSKFIVNGKEYGSVEEMPADIRAAYEKAIKSSSEAGHTGILGTEKTKFVFNCKEYASEDAMRQEERELYRVMMQAMEKQGISMPGGMDEKMGVPRPDAQIPEGSRKPIVPESSIFPGKLISIVAVLVFLLGFTYLLFASGR